ncbi:hypothetical protein BS78_10G082000 [Paspalum vaginatum]|nr:hypothetical protein BS78_10G082000 [Paspalum vaginatum]
MNNGPSMSELVLYVLLLTTLFLSAPAATSTAAGLTMRAELTHVDKGRGFTRWELMTRMLARSRARAASLHQRGGGRNGAHPATVPAVPSNMEYLIHFAIGTPRPQHVALTLDTGSDVVWTQCQPCYVCFDQPFPVFDPSASSTIREVGCGEPLCGASYGFTISACYMKSYQCFYLESYGDGSVTAGFMRRDTFTFKAADGKGAPVAVPDLAFGCGEFNNGLFTSNESGIAGFGRGPQSLPSQLKVGKFSYCFTDMFKEKTSPVFLGVPHDLRAHSTGPIRSDPRPSYRTLSTPATTTFLSRASPSARRGCRWTSRCSRSRGTAQAARSSTPARASPTSRTPCSGSCRARSWRSCRCPSTRTPRRSATTSCASAGSHRGRRRRR